jgi:hypothetical protein
MREDIQTRFGMSMTSFYSALISTQAFTFSTVALLKQAGDHCRDSFRVTFG